MNELLLGDATQDNSLIILDEDRLCYSVKSVSNGGVGVRTISKALLAEWVEVYKKTPNAPSQTVRAYRTRQTPSRRSRLEGELSSPLQGTRC